MDWWLIGGCLGGFLTMLLLPTVFRPYLKPDFLNNRWHVFWVIVLAIAWPITLIALLYNVIYRWKRGIEDGS